MATSSILSSNTILPNTTQAINFNLTEYAYSSMEVNNDAVNWMNRLLDCNPIRQNFTIAMLIIVLILALITGVFMCGFVLKYNICCNQPQDQKQNPNLIILCYIFFVSAFSFQLSFIVDSQVVSIKALSFSKGSV